MMKNLQAYRICLVATVALLDLDVVHISFPQELKFLFEMMKLLLFYQRQQYELLKLQTF